MRPARKTEPRSPGEAPLSQRFAGRSLGYGEALFHTMDDLLRRRPEVVIFGQGVDDHRGIFGTTLGLNEKYGGDRVFDTPLAEEGMTGVAIGTALNGLYPIQTHIRADFSLLAMNQIVNVAAKYKYMSGGRLECPLLIRMIIGRSWGQGAQHSQSLQALFSHIPGLTVVMPASSYSVLRLYPFCVEQVRGPVVSLEHRLLYDVSFRIPTEESGTSPLAAQCLRKGRDLTVVATSVMVIEALRAAEYLAAHGIECEVIDLNCVSHPDAKAVLESVRKTGRLCIADTSWQAYGVAAEICRLVAETEPQALKAPVVTLGMQPAPCPTAKSLEDLFYPNERELVNRLATLVRGTSAHGVPLPSPQTTVEAFRAFKGPF